MKVLTIAETRPEPLARSPSTARRSVSSEDVSVPASSMSTIRRRGPRRGSGQPPRPLHTGAEHQQTGHLADVEQPLAAEPRQGAGGCDNCATSKVKLSGQLNGYRLRCECLLNRATAYLNARNCGFEVAWVNLNFVAHRNHT